MRAIALPARAAAAGREDAPGTRKEAKRVDFLDGASAQHLVGHYGYGAGRKTPGRAARHGAQGEAPDGPGRGVKSLGRTRRIRRVRPVSTRMRLERIRPAVAGARSRGREEAVSL